MMNRTTTLADEYARKAQDWRKQLRQLFVEQKQIADFETEFGVELPVSSALGTPAKEESGDDGGNSEKE